MLMSTTQRFTHNRICFSLLGLGGNDIVAYNMDRRKVHVIPTCYSQFLKHGILPEINGRPYYLPYVPLFSELESLAEE
jgi:hypothetical protein